MSKTLFIAVIITTILIPAGLLAGCSEAESISPPPAVTSEPAATPEPVAAPAPVTTPEAEPTATPAPVTTPEPVVSPAPAVTPEPETTPEYSLSYVIVDTGQDECYNNSRAITAPSPGSAFYGQDAQYDGNQPSYTISADGLTVYDNVTGLTWTQGADWTGDGVVDVADKFTYGGAQTYVATLNAQNYGGFSDWRVPSIKELYSLIDYRGTDPNPMATGFSGLVPFIDDDVFEFAYGDMSAGERIIDSQWVTTTLYVSTVMNNTTAMFGVIRRWPHQGLPRGTDAEPAGREAVLCPLLPGQYRIRAEQLRRQR